MHALFLYSALRNGLANCDLDSYGVCDFPASQPMEDASVLLQKSLLASMEAGSNAADSGREEELLGLAMHAEAAYESHDANRVVNGSQAACKLCWGSIRHGAANGAFWHKCKNETLAANNGKWQKRMRGEIKTCVFKANTAYCKDNCTWGTPCDQCKRAVPKADGKKMWATCKANASAHMKALCADSCPSSTSAHFVENAEDDEDMTHVDAKLDPNLTRRALQAKCTWCLRKDHNKGLEKACTRKWHGSTWWPFGVACVGNGILKKCKKMCSFHSECGNCHQHAIISRKTWLVGYDKKKCFSKKLGEQFCSDKCSSVSLGQADGEEDSDQDKFAEHRSEELRRTDFDKVLLMDEITEQFLADEFEDQWLQDEVSQ